MEIFKKNVSKCWESSIFNVKFEMTQITSYPHGPSLQRIQGRREMMCLPRERHVERHIFRATANI